jgi:uncharacterized GH25 family protein
MMQRTSFDAVSRLAFVLALLVAVNGAAVLAHDLWIEPTTFTPAPGQIMGVRLRVGENLVGDPVRRNAALVDEFVLQDTAGRRPVIGRNGADPAGLVRVGAAGVQVIGYRSRPSALDATAAKFNQYLREEGLDTIVALRAQRNETNADTRELFSRCAKSLVLSGGNVADGGDRVLGFPLELVAERNPYALGERDELPIRLTYENRPLANALVVALNRANPGDKLTARTDRDGRVRFPVAAKGMWLIKSVHMVPAAEESGAQWASFWASLTFELQPATRSQR